MHGGKDGLYAYAGKVLHVDLTAGKTRTRTRILEGKGTKEYGTLPWKIKNAPVPDKRPAKGAVVSDEEFQVGLDDYYEARGWTMDGIPTVEKLNELNPSEYSSIVQGEKA